MVEKSVDLLELLRKRLGEADLDFLREAVAILADAIMEAEVTAQAGADYGERSPERIAQRVPCEALGYARRQHRARDSEAAPR